MGSSRGAQWLLPFDYFRLVEGEHCRRLSATRVCGSYAGPTGMWLYSVCCLRSIFRDEIGSHSFPLHGTRSRSLQCPNTPPDNVRKSIPVHKPAYIQPRVRVCSYPASGRAGLPPGHNHERFCWSLLLPGPRQSVTGACASVRESPELPVLCLPTMHATVHLRRGRGR